MQNRKICFDTETTGLFPEEGERIFDIGCVELINDVRTGRTLQFYINPEKPLSEDSKKITNIEDNFLFDKPKFADVADDILDFIGDASLIAHNAIGFDMKFLNNELKLLGRKPLKNDVIDTLLMARRKFPGQKVKLDALCAKFGIDNTKRVFHGALLDAELLVDVYVQLIGGIEKRLIEDKTSSIDEINKTIQSSFAEVLTSIKSREGRLARDFPMDEEELRLHREFIAEKINNAIWREEET